MLSTDTSAVVISECLWAYSSPVWLRKLDRTAVATGMHAVVVDLISCSHWSRFGRRGGDVRELRMDPYRAYGRVRNALQTATMPALGPAYQCR